MTDRHSLIAYLATLFAILYLASIAAFLAFNQRYAEALGFGGLTTALVAVLGTWKPASNKTTQNIDTATNVNAEKGPAQ